MEKKKNFQHTIILTSCIKPENIPYLKRSDEKDRFKDYKDSFRKWCKNKQVKKIIFIENSGYDLEFFHQEAKNFSEKEIEIISSSLNNTFDKSLGKGYGEYLCFKEILERSKLFKEIKFFIKVSGRYYIKNYNKIFEEFERKKPEIFIFLKDNLTFADSHFFGGSKNFLTNYVVPFSSNTNDSEGIFMEHCLAQAALQGINNNLSFNSIETYLDIEGIIGTNNKKIKNNFLKRLKLYFYGKIKNYIYSHKKY